MREYYDARAGEYDEWYEGLGQFAERARPEWEQSVQRLELALAGLAPARTLDIACGTGYLTRRLPGEVTALDQSERMLAIARRRLPRTSFVRGDALALPFEEDAFERVFTGHFYGHLENPEREQFLAEARRVARELVVVDSALEGAAGGDAGAAQEWQERRLNDGSRFSVYKRYFTAAGLAGELGGGTVLHESRWFVAVSSPRDAMTDPPVERS